MDFKGLSSREATDLLRVHGSNEIKDVGRVAPLMILFRQIRGNVVLYLLVVAMLLSFFVEKPITAYALLAIILLVVVIGFFQEYRAETAIQALRSMITPVSVVIRDGKTITIPARELVVGDIVLLRTGERVPADGLILEANELKVNESLLTGESAEVSKFVSRDGDGPDTHYVFMGTFVVHGRATVQITKTGMSSRFGAIANLISREQKELPLQKKVNGLARYAIFVALFFALATGIIYALRADAFTATVLVDALIIMIALAVSAFPESFPVVLITTLSAGAHRMALQNAIVNRMSVIETLGETTVICSDKTGTLTKGEMTAKYAFVDGRVLEISGAGYTAEGEFRYEGASYDVSKDKVLDLVCKGAVACNDASISRSGSDDRYEVVGTATETALLVMAAKAGFVKEQLHVTRKAEIPFSSERKLMSVLVHMGKSSFVFTKGAPEYVLDACTKIHRKDGVFSLTVSERKRLAEMVHSFSTRGYRTIALAYKPSTGTTIDHEKGLIFLGIVALEDPPRPEVIAALRECMHAGIAVKMITGDHRETALSIASQIGLHGPLLTGEHLDALSDSALVQCVGETVIFARVRPEHKLRIVNALKARGEVVTMTGDGVNDAPALKAAQVGVAMGISGTDVSRSVADITLKDDNFATIVNAVREGRTIFNNMRKFITYQFSCVLAEILVIFFGIFLGLPLPLVAIQILFMNMITDDFPAITLGLNPSSHDVMDHKPRRKESLLTRNHIHMLIIAGAIMGLGTLGVYVYALYIAGMDVAFARTAALVTLICFEIIGAFNFRSFRKSTLGRSPFVNRSLVMASFVSLLATFAILYTPISVFFETVALPWHWWIVSVVLAFVFVGIFDALKSFNARACFWKDVC